jgi:hypothetical protein
VLLAIAGVLAGTALLVFIGRRVPGWHHDGWARALARCLVGLAGRVHRSRADEWMADIVYLQTVEEHRAGLREAVSHLCGAPKLALRALVTAVGQCVEGLDQRQMSLKLCVLLFGVPMATTTTLISTWSQGVGQALLTTAVSASLHGTCFWSWQRRERRRAAARATRPETSAQK